MKTPADAFASILIRLCEEGSIPASRLSERSRSRLLSLFDSGVLSEEKSGAGRRVVVKSKAHLLGYVETEYPSGLEADPASFSTRADGIMAFRDSKRISTPVQEPVLLRAFEGVCLRSGSIVLPAADLTSRFGLAAFLLDDTPSFGSDGPVATVENAELFNRFEKLQTGIGLAIYTAGRISGRMLGWLASEGMSRCAITHYGDWDPVGLDEYLRIRKACPGRTSLFVPDDFEILLQRFGKRELLAGSNSVLLPRLASSDDEIVRRLVELMRRHNAGLEQEVLLRGSFQDTKGSVMNRGSS